MRRIVLLAIAATAIGPLARADEPHRAGQGPPAPRAWAVEVASEIQREAWNYNLSDEDLFGGSAGLGIPSATRDYAEMGVTRSARPTPELELEGSVRVDSHYEYSFRVLGFVSLRWPNGNR